MGYYEGGPPRHGHRQPSEIAEDERLSALYSDRCHPDGDFTKKAPYGKTAGFAQRKFALVRWTDGPGGRRSQ